MLVISAYMDVTSQYSHLHDALCDGRRVEGELDVAFESQWDIETAFFLWYFELGLN